MTYNADLDLTLMIPRTAVRELIAQAVAAEREACAKLAEHDPAANCAHGPSHDSCIRQDRCTCLTDVIRGEAIARAIRARGQKTEQ